MKSNFSSKLWTISIKYNFIDLSDLCNLCFPTSVQAYGKIEINGNNEYQFDWPLEFLNPIQLDVGSPQRIFFNILTNVMPVATAQHLTFLPVLLLTWALWMLGPPAVTFCMLLCVNVSVILSHFTPNSSNTCPLATSSPFLMHSMFYSFFSVTYWSATALIHMSGHHIPVTTCYDTSARILFLRN